MKRQGFTLTELLTVMAIIGILIAVGIAHYARWRASSAVLQGAQEFGQAVAATRTGAKRANACWQISLVSTAASNTQYQVKEYSGPICSTTAGTLIRTRTYTLPPGTTLTLSTGASSMNFTPPYGTTDGAPDTFVVRWAANTDLARTVRVTSIFGKVIIK
ncbi:Tfp pilus assembly protein FimT/FimU [Deinococcus sp. YIM 77859]|uniref:pilus assembly FimT family protein n=1 Tax=Deinococcus sp. YIM 77859 TaxID=1540221 RepID=UPI000551B26D|nr:type II secretion system protein [Deinococcus sp. YIM 77859]